MAVTVSFEAVLSNRRYGSQSEWRSF